MAKIFHLLYGVLIKMNPRLDMWNTQKFHIINVPSKKKRSSTQINIAK